MNRIAILLLTVLAAMACRAAPETPFPPGPNLPGGMDFVEADSAGRVMRELTVVFTDQPAKTCLPGDWRQARGVKGSKNFPQHPVYKLHDGKLELLLVNGTCDAYETYVGTLTYKYFQGEHVEYGQGSSKTLNTVTGAYVLP